MKKGGLVRLTMWCGCGGAVVWQLSGLQDEIYCFFDRRYLSVVRFVSLNCSG